MAEKKKKGNGILYYKGFPLVRKGDVLYYGNPTDPYIIAIHILDKEERDGLMMTKKATVELLYTDPDLKAKDRVLRHSEKNGLYNAMSIGSVWLDRALKGKV